MSLLKIGCCGAYCKTCPEYRAERCSGCKSGYAEGTRDLAKARCKIKICCLGKKLPSCAGCETYPSCKIIQGFFAKNGYKYKKYEQASLFIRDKGYDAFLKIADCWQRQYGKYK